VEQAPEGIRLKNLGYSVHETNSRFVRSYATNRDRIIEAGTVTNCLQEGYAPRGYGLVDFSLIKKGNEFHLFHIPHVYGNDFNNPSHTHWLAHAVTRDLDTWTTLNPCLYTDPLSYYESAHIWAPFVIKDSNEYHMYYAGLSLEPSQVLCKAISSDPELSIWHKAEANPIIPLHGFDWHWLNQRGHVRNARDPHVIRVGSDYLMAYTAMHRDGCPAVGGLISSNLESWEDIGPMLFRSSKHSAGLPESVNIQRLEDGNWVLIPSMSPGLEYYISDDPFHWHGPKPTRIEYENGDRDKALAVEVIERDEENRTWLVAFFEYGEFRLRIGLLNRRKHPWTLKRISRPETVSEWLS
jgi:hypothetical protein